MTFRMCSRRLANSSNPRQRLLMSRHLQVKRLRHNQTTQAHQGRRSKPKKKKWSSNVRSGYSSQEEADAAAAAEREAAIKDAAAGDGDGDDITPLTTREIKGMNPNMLKEHLKARGLSTQGNKKALMARLTEACK